jgi:E3 ubiquitin-protein ligase HERC2
VSAAVTARGQVFTWGRTKNVVFGGDANLDKDPGVSLSSTTNLVLPTPLEAEGIVFTKVACGKTHFVGITNNGRLISWGNADQGKLGHRKIVLTEEEKKKQWEIYRKRGYSPKNYAEKEEIDFVVGDLESKKVVDFACGFQHTVAVTQEGEVYTWGFGKNGALGHGDWEMVDLPKKIENLSNIIKIKCGIDYTIAMDKDGKLYSWGSNRYGQLGVQGTNS